MRIWFSAAFSVNLGTSALCHLTVVNSLHEN